MLAARYHVIAPDYPGFGQSEAPPPDRFAYTFDHLTDVIGALTQVLHVERYSLFVHDYGAPVGLRLAVRYPERVQAIVTQNGNAYDAATRAPDRSKYARRLIARCRGIRPQPPF